MQSAQRAFLAAEAALFFALITDSANDRSPPPGPGLRAARRVSAGACTASCTVTALPAATRPPSYSRAEPMLPCASVSRAV